ncbi:hypothetical protein CsSME_00001193 [Camellia sinensis var. sinensis]
MQKSGLMPDQFTFGSIIRSCSSLSSIELGRQLHVHVIKSEFGSHVIAQNALIAMYTKFGQIADALDVFSGIKKKDFIPWNAIISGFAYGGDANKAMLFFSQMRHLALTPDDITVRSLLCACTSPVTLNQGMQIQPYLIKVGFDLGIAVCNTLLSMYAKCSDLYDTFKMLNEMTSNADSFYYSHQMLLSNKPPNSIM